MASAAVATAALDRFFAGNGRSSHDRPTCDGRLPLANAARLCLGCGSVPADIAPAAIHLFAGKEMVRLGDCRHCIGINGLAAGAGAGLSAARAPTARRDGAICHRYADLSPAG